MPANPAEQNIKFKNGSLDAMDLTEQSSRFLDVRKLDEERLHTSGSSTTWRKGARRAQKCLHWLRKNLFLLLTSLGIIAGFLIGIGVRTAHPSPDTIMWIGMPGEVYMRILQAMVLPLIVCTVIDGTAHTDPKSNGRMGLVTLIYIITTNALGVILGIALCLIIKPGSAAGHGTNDAVPDTKNLQTVDIFADFIRNTFPDNVVAATMFMSQTKYTMKEFTSQNNVSGSILNVTTSELLKSASTASGTNILGLIVISAAIGIAASRSGEKGRPFIDFFSSGARIIFQLFYGVQWTTPIGVASLIAKALAKIDNIQSAFSSMGMFILTTSGGCIAYQWTFLPLIFVIMTRKNPLKFLSHAVKPCLLGFGPASSTIPLPEMMKMSVDIYKVDPRVAGFTLPFCVTLNRDGSCLFIAAACLFVAQYGGLSVDTSQVFTLAILCIMSSLAIPSVPSSSVVAVIIILSSMGIPANNIGLIMAVDWLNDRIRTTANVVSHLVACLTTWRLCKTSLESENRKNANIDDVKEVTVM